MTQHYQIGVAVNPAGAVAGGRVVERSLDSIHNKANRTRTSIQYLSASMFGMSAFLIGHQINQYASMWVSLENRLRQVATSAQNLKAIMDELYGVAQRTRAPIEATIDLYFRMARNARDLGYSQKEFLVITEAINKAMIVSAPTVREAHMALVQFGQAIASNRLGGDELRAVLEQLPRLAQLIAKGMGIPFAQLRYQASLGRVDTKRMIEAIRSQMGELEEEFKKVMFTAEHGWTNLASAFQRYVGVLYEASGLNAALGRTFNYMASQMDVLGNSIMSIGAAFATWIAIEYIPKTLKIIISFLSPLRFLSLAVLSLGYSFYFFKDSNNWITRFHDRLIALWNTLQKMDSVKNVFSSIVNSSAVKEIENTAYRIREWFFSTWNYIASDSLRAFEDVASTIYWTYLNLIPNLKSLFADFYKWMADSFLKVNEAMMKIMNEVLSSAYFEILTTKFENFMDKMKNKMNDVADKTGMTLKEGIHEAGYYGTWGSAAVVGASALGVLVSSYVPVIGKFILGRIAVPIASLLVSAVSAIPTAAIVTAGIYGTVWAGNSIYQKFFKSKEKQVEEQLNYTNTDFYKFGENKLDLLGTYEKTGEILNTVKDSTRKEYDEAKQYLETNKSLYDISQQRIDFLKRENVFWNNMVEKSKEGFSISDKMNQDEYNKIINERKELGMLPIYKSTKTPIESFSQYNNYISGEGARIRSAYGYNPLENFMADMMPSILPDSEKVKFGIGMSEYAKKYTKEFQDAFKNINEYVAKFDFTKSFEMSEDTLKERIENPMNTIDKIISGAKDEIGKILGDMSGADISREDADKKIREHLESYRKDIHKFMSEYNKQLQKLMEDRFKRQNPYADWLNFSDKSLQEYLTNLKMTKPGEAKLLEVDLVPKLNFEEWDMLYNKDLSNWKEDQKIPIIRDDYKEKFADILNVGRYFYDEWVGLSEKGIAIPSLTAEQERQFKTLTERILPLTSATREYENAQKLLSAAFKANGIQEEEQIKYLEGIKKLYEDTLDPFGAINREMDKEIKLSRMLTDEKEIESQAMKYEQQLRKAYMGDRTEEQIQKEVQVLREKLQTIQKINKEMDYMNKMYREIKDPQDEFAYGTVALGKLYASGKITFMEYAATLNKMKETFRGYYADMLMNTRKWKAGAVAALSDYASMATDAARNFYDAWSSAISKTEDLLTEFFSTGKMNFTDFINSIVQDVNRAFVRQNITGPLTSMLGLNMGVGNYGGAIGSALFPFAGARAGGGSVNPYQSYMVGENGPEMFIPATSGKVVNNDQGVTIGRVVINNNSPNSNGSKYSERQNMKRFAKSVASQINRR